jgi:predicted PurR-regulated permease PerM
MNGDKRPALDLTHTTLSVLLIALLIASSFWVLSPFLMAIVWATIISVTAWPLLLRLQAALGDRRKLAVTIVTIVLLLVVFVPVMAALTTLVRNAEGITTEIKTLETVAIPAPPDWLAHLPVVGRTIVTRWTQFAGSNPDERWAALAPYLQTALQWFVSKAGGLGSMLVQFLLTTIITALILSKGEVVRDALLRFSRRLAGQQGEDAALLAGRAIRAVVLGVAVTALIQVAIGGTGLYLTGVPAAGLLSAMMLFLCLAQIGPLPLLVPIVVWLYWSNQSGAATTLLPFALVAGTIDNVIRPVLIKRGANLPLLLIFAGVIGGLIAFGIVGLFVGPVVLAVTFTLLKTWVAGGPPAAAAAGDAAAPGDTAGTR